MGQGKARPTVEVAARSERRVAADVVGRATGDPRRRTPDYIPDMSDGPVYREHAPSDDLANHVACYWTARGEPVRESRDVGATDRVLPDACMDVLFDLTRGAAILVGTMTRPLDVSRAERTDLVGVRFRPGGIGAVLSLPAHEVTDTFFPLEAVWGDGAGALAHRLPEAPTTAQRLSLIEAELRRRIAGGRGGDRRVQAAAGLVERAAGGIRVETLADVAGLGTRQLERRFLAAVGLPPRTACRVVRFQTAVVRMHARPTSSLARVALESGYHDQAHFTREFRTFAGESPGAYRRRRNLGVASVQDGPSGRD